MVFFLFTDQRRFSIAIRVGVFGNLAQQHHFVAAAFVNMAFWQRAQKRPFGPACVTVLMILRRFRADQGLLRETAVIVEMIFGKAARQRAGPVTVVGMLVLLIIAALQLAAFGIAGLGMLMVFFLHTQKRFASAIASVTVHMLLFEAAAQSGGFRIARVAMDMLCFQRAQQVFAGCEAAFAVRMSFLLRQLTDQRASAEGMTLLAMSMSAFQTVTFLRVLMHRHSRNRAGEVTLFVIAGCLMCMDYVIHKLAGQFFLLVIAIFIMLVYAQRLIGTDQFVVVNFSSLNVTFCFVEMGFKTAEGFTLLRDRGQNQRIGGTKNDKATQDTYDSFP